MVPRATARGDGPCPFGSQSRSATAYAAAKSGFLGRHSYVFNLALAGAWRLAYDRNKKSIDFRYDIRFPDGKTTTFNSRNGDLDEVTYASALVRNEVELDLLDQPLVDSRSLWAPALHFVPIVVYIPSAYTAYREMAHFDDAAVETILRQFSDRQRDYFARQAGEAGFVYRDLTSALQRVTAELPSTRPLYFRTNVHLTPAGHAVVAAEVAEEISEDSSAATISPGKK